MSASPSPEQDAPEASRPATKPSQHDIFGGSDSELSDSDDEAPVPKRKPFPPRSGPAPPLETQADDDLEADVARPEREASPSDDDDDDDDHDEAYVPATAETAAKIPKFKKKKKRDADDDDLMDGEGADVDEGESRERRKKKKSKKERRRRDDVEEGEEDVPAAVLDEVTLRRRAREEQIDNIGRNRKPIRRKKKDDVDIVDTYYDEVCAQLKQKMHNAAVRDIEAVTGDGTRFATSKLVMLDEVMAVLRNTMLFQAIIDSGLLEEVRLWLEPIDPTADLPAVGIQNAFFEILPKLDIDTATLKECKLGPLIQFYTKTTRVTPSIKRAAEELIQTWSRPIIKRPNDFRSRKVDTLDDIDGNTQGGARGGDSQSGANGEARGGNAAASQRMAERRRRFDVNMALKENQGRKGARMPQVRETQYTVAPESRTSHHSEDLQHVSRIQQDNKKFNKFARQLRMARR